MGLPGPMRLTRREDYQRLYEKGRKFIHPLAVFFVLPATTAQARIGLTVSRRIGNACVRNRVKRRLREVWRGRLGGLAPADIVMVARAGLASAEYSGFEEAVTRFLRWLRPRQS